MSRVQGAGRAAWCSATMLKSVHVDHSMRLERISCYKSVILHTCTHCLLLPSSKLRREMMCKYDCTTGWWIGPNNGIRIVNASRVISDLVDGEMPSHESCGLLNAVVAHIMS